MKPIIGIAGNQLIRATDTFQGNQVSYTPQGFVDAVLDAQGLPLILPVMSPDSASQLIGQIDKLILAGGQDVSPQLYMEDPHPKLTETNIQRDQFEQALILEALKQRKPIFAVCRGLQLLNVVLEGTLYQDLSLYPKWSVKHEQQPTAPPIYDSRSQDCFRQFVKQPSPRSIFCEFLPSSGSQRSFTFIKSHRFF